MKLFLLAFSLFSLGSLVSANANCDAPIWRAIHGPFLKAFNRADPANWHLFMQKPEIQYLLGITLANQDPTKFRNRALINDPHFFDSVPGYLRDSIFGKEVVSGDSGFSENSSTNSDNIDNNSHKCDVNVPVSASSSSEEVNKCWAGVLTLGLAQILYLEPNRSIEEAIDMLSSVMKEDVRISRIYLLICDVK
jgi:hypothetical protein